MDAPELPVEPVLPEPALLAPEEVEPTPEVPDAPELPVLAEATEEVEPEEVELPEEAVEVEVPEEPAVPEDEPDEEVAVDDPEELLAPAVLPPELVDSVPADDVAPVDAPLLPVLAPEVAAPLVPAPPVALEEAEEGALLQAPSASAATSGRSRVRTGTSGTPS